jgi:hypothetical protein
MDLGNKVWRDERLDGRRKIENGHAHLLCVACNQVTCLPNLERRPVGGEETPV